MFTAPKPNWSGVEELEHAMENMEAIKKFNDGDLYPMVNILPEGHVTNEARKFYATSKPHAVCSAMVTNSFLQKILGNFFLNFNRVDIPIRLFTDPEEAESWAKSFLND